MPEATTHPVKSRIWTSFAALCLLVGSRWIAATWQPSDLPTLLEQGLHELTIGLVAAAACIGRKPFPSPRKGTELAAYGVLLLALPSALSFFARGGVSGLSGLALLTLVPAITTFIAANQADTFGADDNTRSLLLPALAATGGAFLLIHVAIPDSLPGRLWLFGLGLAAIPVAIACVRLHRLLQQAELLAALAIVYIAAGSTSFVLYAIPVHEFTHWSTQTTIRETAFTLLIDAPIAWLTVHLLRATDPIRYTTRYLFIPLISLVEGLFLIHPPLTPTMGGGIALLLGGAIVLLVRSTPDRSQIDTLSPPSGKLH